MPFYILCFHNLYLNITYFSSSSSDKDDDTVSIMSDNSVELDDYMSFKPYKSCVKKKEDEISSCLKKKEEEQEITAAPNHIVRAETVTVPKPIIKYGAPVVVIIIIYWANIALTLFKALIA